MRVELVYAPGCNSYRKALHLLETIIAEECLPIPVELQEASGGGDPVIRINGLEFAGSTSSHEHLRSSLSATWRELTVPS